MKTLKTIFAGVIALVIMVSAANAQSFVSAKTTDNFAVKYVGVDDGYLCFQVEALGFINSNAVLKISDKYEGELYSQNWKVKSPNQIFKIEKRDGQQLIFNLQIGDQLFTKTLSATTSVEEKVLVEESKFEVM